MYTNVCTRTDTCEYFSKLKLVKGNKPQPNTYLILTIESKSAKATTVLMTNRIGRNGIIVGKSVYVFLHKVGKCLISMMCYSRLVRICVVLNQSVVCL